MTKWIYTACLLLLSPQLLAAKNTPSTDLYCSALRSSGSYSINELIFKETDSGAVDFFEITATAGTDPSAWYVCDLTKQNDADLESACYSMSGRAVTTTSGGLDFYVINESIGNDGDGDVVLLDGPITGGGKVLDHIRYCKSGCQNTTRLTIESACYGYISYSRGFIDGIARAVDGRGGWITQTNNESTMGYSNTGNVSSCELGSFSVSQSSSSLACPETRAAVSVEALCADGVTVKRDYKGTVSLSATGNGRLYTAAEGGSSVSSYTFRTQDGGSRTFYLEKSNTGSSTVTVTGNTSGKSGSGADTAFHAYGLVLSDPADNVCGTTQNLTLSAFGQRAGEPGCGVLTNFSGSNLPLKAWYRINTDPDEATSTATVDAVGAPITLAGQNVSVHSEPAATNLSLTFSAGQAVVPVNYRNVGDVLDLNFKYDTAPYDGSTSDGVGNRIGPLTAVSSSFVVRPKRIAQSIADPSHSCASGDGSCSAFVAAGTDFDLTLTAQCEDGSTASQYKTGAQPVAFDTALMAPAGGESAVLAVTGTTFAAGDSGVKTVTQSLSEVGVFDLEAIPASYFGTTIDTDTLSSVGRFYAHHFTLDGAESRVDAACDLATAFSYMDQPLSLFYVAQARNAAGDATYNYRDSFVKMDATQGTIVAGALDNSQNLSSRVTPVDTSLRSGASFSWSQGEGEVSVPLYLARSATPDGPFEALALGVNMTDSDGATLASAVLDLDVGSGSAEYAQLGDTVVRYGRLAVLNAHGPETSPLLQPIQAQYYNGSYFTRNAADGCTTLSSSDITLQVDSNSPLAAGVLTNVGIGSGSTDAALSANTLGNGQTTLGFTAPGAGNTGVITTRAQADSWLRFDWNGDGDIADNPDASGQVGFGRFRGSDRVIYWGE